ncbi:hypothetical protein ACFFV7_38990 [Nonomuraea spiralis]|uniref:Uncharacterized protein n=1 Tax=Nonomuraea spiralis TaxID=46182 RepID=A0ABV5IT39_9ACTN|nr:hypothetical protein [Nonomuraea spiralis]GGT42806.1 hypothetical protein GCM10010176_102910 [Nonomuraea spiralis]
MNQPNIDTLGSLGNVFGASAAGGLGGLPPTRQQPGKDTSTPAADPTPSMPYSNIPLTKSD